MIVKENLDVELGVKPVGYFVTFTLVTYLTSIVYVHLTPNPNLASRLLIMASLFVIVYILVRFFYGNPFKPNQPASYYGSLIHVLALLVLGYIPPVIAMIVSGPKQLYMDAKPPYVDGTSIFWVMV